jgi:hypothetical protein
MKKGGRNFKRGYGNSDYNGKSPIIVNQIGSEPRIDKLSHVQLIKNARIIEEAGDDPLCIESVKMRQLQKNSQIDPTNAEDAAILDTLDSTFPLSKVTIPRL